MTTPGTTIACRLESYKTENASRVKELFAGKTVINFTTFIILFILSGIFHEIGHATACKSFGVRHGGIGFGFYILYPVLFVDVSDVWRLKSFQRIIVNLSGMYFEMLFAFILIIISLIINNRELSIIPIFIFARTLYNFNPFFRTDGYWVLSDAIGVPNLRKESFLRMHQFFKHITVGAGKEYLNQLKFKDIFLIIYSMISYSFIIFFISFILFIQPSSIVTFPLDFYHFFVGFIKINSDKSQWFFENLGQLILPIVFYYLLISFIIGLLKKKLK